MKKLLALALVLVLALSLVACGGSGLKDGTYKAELSDKAAEDNHGWKDTLVVTVKDGKVTDVDMDGYQGDLRKTEDDSYAMDPHPSEWMPTIEANVKAATSADEVAVVAGATGTSNNAKKLYAAVLEAAAKGNTETVVLD